MGTTTRLLIILITLAIAITTSPIGSAGTTAGAAPVPEPVISGTPDQVALASEALDRFRSAGLELPPLTIGFHEHRSGCRGHNGVFRMVDGQGEIEICRQTMYLLLHELAHAWEAAFMSADTRSDLMDHWDVDNWNDHDQAPGARGAEKVADTIAFALDDPPQNPNPVMMRNLCSYELTTGIPLPNPIDLGCD